MRYRHARPRQRGLSLTVAVCLGGIIATSNDAQAQSLFARRSPRGIYSMQDTAARQVGDLVTILINEATDVANSDQRKLSKGSDTSFNLDFSNSGDVGSAAGTMDIQKQSDRNFSGQSQYSVAQEFSDKITVQIIDVMPNGNLLLGGRRQRMVAGEIRTLIVSGMVRENDIGPNNTVSSGLIANFKVAYEGDGPESSFTQQGWASRFVNKI
ncbi:MAG: flagellar basal body L-ring protein FlgH, partial [Planctomycetales bacterium]|nr:flagellar basal body L-ring protein FlgH [Planctomycetales bacterium]